MQLRPSIQLAQRRNTGVAAVTTMAMLAVASVAGGVGLPGVLSPDWDHVLAADPVYAVGTDGSGKTVVAGGWALHVSQDEGATWTSWDDGDFGATHSVAASVDGAYLFAGGVDGVFLPRIFYSHDQGATWELATLEGGVSGDGSVTAIAPHPTDPAIAVAAVLYELSPGAVLMTEDAGKTWKTVATAPDAQVADVAWWTGDKIAVGTALGLGVVVGSTVEIVFKEAGQMRTLEVHPDGPLYTSAANPEVWRTDGDENDLHVWVDLPVEPADHLALNPLDVEDVWVTTWPGVLLRCSSAGCDDASPPAVTSGSWVSAAGAAFAATEDGVWRAPT